MKSYYAPNVFISYYSALPKRVKLDVQQGLMGGVSRYTIAGTSGSERIDVKRWKEPPHEVLANLRVVMRAGLLSEKHGGIRPIDPEAVEMFIKTYGVPLGIVLDQQFQERLDEAAKRGGYPSGLRVPEPEWARKLPEPRFYVTSEELSDAQSLLRDAWKGDNASIKEIEKQAARILEVRTSVQGGGIELVVKDLWSFIGILFLRDYSAGKARFCARPDCPEPYFVQKRRGQRYCTHRCTVAVNVKRFRARHVLQRLVRDLDAEKVDPRTTSRRRSAITKELLIAAETLAGLERAKHGASRSRPDEPGARDRNRKTKVKSLRRNKHGR